jgi:hypothetical protein
MLTTAIGSVITAIIKHLPPDIVKEGIDKMLDKFEEKIDKTENKWDDLLLPLFKALRAQLGITEEEGSKYADTQE